MATVKQKNYYEILGVDETASAEDIRKVYRELAKKYHPDKTGGDKEAEDRLKEINQAYDVLKNPEKRKKYDQERAFSAGGGFEGFGFSDAFGAGGVSDIFESMFGGRGPSMYTAVRRGNDVEGRVTISLKDVVDGTSKTIRLRRAEFCDECKGSGAASGTAPVSCTACAGSGMQTHGDAMYQVRRTCTVCRGKGEVIATPCGKCGGSGHVRGSREIKVDIPAGIESGMRLRVAGEGEAGDVGAPRGDLYVRVEIEDDPFFTREGADLVCEVPITFTEAALGASIQVPTLDGIAELNVEPGTQNGATLRMRGMGLRSFGSHTRGDERIRIFVEIPPKLNREQKKLLLDYAEHGKRDTYPRVKRFSKLLDRFRRKSAR